jgi:hypothetical protein
VFEIVDPSKMVVLEPHKKMPIAFWYLVVLLKEMSNHQNHIHEALPLPHHEQQGPCMMMMMMTYSTI